MKTRFKYKDYDVIIVLVPTEMSKEEKRIEGFAKIYFIKGEVCIMLSVARKRDYEKYAKKVIDEGELDKAFRIKSKENKWN